MKPNTLFKDALLFVAAVLLVGVLHALKMKKHDDTTTWAYHTVADQEIAY
jgi:hypothetical protein